MKMTDKQEAEYEIAKADNRRQDEGMAKWTLKFSDGKGAIMLTDQCRTPAEAFIAGVEKFGKSFKGVA